MRTLFARVAYASFLWACLMALSALFSLYYQYRLEVSHLLRIIALYFAGGLFAYPLALWFARILSRKPRFETRFAAHFLCLCLFTVGMTSAFYALDYWSFYQRWHAPFLTKIWVYQLIGTNLGALFQFSVMGLRLFLPFGLIALAGIALLEARRR